MNEIRESAVRRTEGLVSIRAVAEMLGVTERYVRRLVFERQIEFVKVGHYVRFDPNIVNDWIEDRRQAPVVSTSSDKKRFRLAGETDPDRLFALRDVERARGK